MTICCHMLCRWPCLPDYLCGLINYSIRRRISVRWEAEFLVDNISDSLWPGNFSGSAHKTKYHSGIISITRNTVKKFVRVCPFSHLCALLMHTHQVSTMTTGHVHNLLVAHGKMNKKVKCWHRGVALQQPWTVISCTSISLAHDHLMDDTLLSVLWLLHACTGVWGV